MPSDNSAPASGLPGPSPAHSRRPRGESRASLAVESNQTALSQTLRAGHHAASQSQDLTVFSDLTTPPTSNSLPENKGLTNEIQGGLSGLYNKFKASMVGGKEPETIPKAVSADTVLPESVSTTASSGRTSRVHSPRVNASDATMRMDSSTSKLSANPAAAMKLNLSSSALRSPNGPAHLVGPALTELNIHATGNAKTHSRDGSSQGVDENVQLDRSLPSPIEEYSLRNAFSQVEQDSILPHHDRRMHSPQPTLAKLDTTNIVPSHSRGISESSMYALNDKAQGRTFPTPSSATNDNSLNRTTTNIGSPNEYRSSINPLELLASSERAEVAVRHAQRNMSPPARARESIPISYNRINQSKLPGFQASRASSTSSGRTSGVVTFPKDTRHSAPDGQTGNNQRLQRSRASSRLKSRLLEKEYWMRDENARECYSCGEPFTTFRRKHHCRTCGQIFDNKCTTLMSGLFFDVPGAVRVCRQCEVIIISHEDDSSDYSDDPTTADLSARPRTPDMSAARHDDDNMSIVSQSLEHMARTPVMSLPVRRAYDKSNRASAILEFDTHDHNLYRPSSSRSLRNSHSFGHGHKRHHSKHQHIRSFKPYHEDRVPFQRRTQEEYRDMKTSAFHRDSVIDPELAQYLSDDPSSEDESVLRTSHSVEKLSRSGPDNDRTTIGGLLAAMRKGRSRMGDRSIAGFLNFSRDADDAASVISSRAIDGVRGSRKRTASVSSSVHHKSTPRNTKERLHIVLPPGHDTDSPSSPAFPPQSGSRMIRSASMHGIGAPSLELNKASIQHVHKMLRQLLKDAKVPRVSRWEDALIPILLRATDDVDPDVQGGDDIDIRSYVKLKKIPGGKPADTSYTSGLIFTKNIALKSMQRSIAHPRILIITFPLEYARSESHFMSLDPVIRQEREYLGNIVSRIAALRPDVLLAEKHISGLALELLDQARIAVVYNVKRAVLEAVSRCTHTAVHHSIDRLTLPAEQLGTCELFEVKTYLADGRRKTYVYISGCPPELGCTIALRGATREILDRIKRLTDFMIYVVYNLKLETCLMRDEWALIPSNDNLARSSIASSASRPDKPSELVLPQPPKTVEDHSHLSQVEAVDSEKLETGGSFETTPEVRRLSTNDSSEIPEDIPVPMFYQELADKHETRILSASPFVKFAQPYLLMRAREFERRVAYFKRLRDQDLSDSVNLEEKAKAQKFTLITPEMVHSSLKGTSKKVREIVHAVHDAEYEKALFYYDQQKKQWEAHLSGNRNLFDPYAHQNIVVLFSVVSTHTNVPCSGPDMLAFSFYNEHEYEQGFEADCTIGQYVEDLCYRANDPCSTGACGKRMFEHHRQYVHGEAQITVFVEPHFPKLRGLQDVILMWSTCKICGTETTVTPMSPSTWKYSFGKYLELSFWSADLHARAGGCPHDLHRDHLRYFGYKGFALRVHHDHIDLLEVIVPRMRVTWKVDNDLRFRNEIYTRLEQRITKFMVSVKLRLKSINVDALLPDSIDACRNEVDKLTKQANEDHATLVKQLQEGYTNSQYWEVIPLNVAMRALQEKVADWDDQFAEFEKNFFPSEKDIRRLATLQLKKIFLDRDVSVTSLTSGEEEGTPPSGTEQVDEDHLSPEDGTSLTRKLSREKAENVLQSVVEEHGTSPQLDNEKLDFPTPITPMPITLQPDEIRRASAELEHLDLALSDTATEASNTAAVTVAETSPRTVSPEIVIVPDSPDKNVIDVERLPPVPNAEQQTPAIEISEPTQTPSRTELPIPLEASSGRNTISRPNSPMLARTQSQPTGSFSLRKEFALPKPSTMSAINAMNGFGSGIERRSTEVHHELIEKKLPDRFGITGLKTQKHAKSQSLIPRAIAARKESRVSNLAKHFEQLSREFEQARIKERRERAARNRRSQIYPLAAPKPIVEVYKSVDDAVDEVDESEETLHEVENTAADTGESMAQSLAETTKSDTVDEGSLKATVDPTIETTEKDADEAHHSSHVVSEAEDRTDAEGEEEEEEEEAVDNIQLPDSPEDLLRLSKEDAEYKDLPKHERTSLMKMLTNFWAERSSSGWATLEYPLMASDHVFADCDIIVREDELSSIIAFALDSKDYNRMLRNIQDRHDPLSKSANSKASSNAVDDNDEDVISHSLLRKTGTHLKYQFAEGPAKMLCKVFFAEQFDAMRRKCGVADRFIESLSRCIKYDSKGGKSKSLFLKTLDDRFVLKSLSPVETQSFLKFAPNYFQIMSEAFFHDLPSVIAKMLGFYQVIIKNPATGVEHNWFLLVMENLFYDRIPTRIFDLKGSMRNRKINATGERNEVLLDENMVEFIYESPLFAREHSKKVLRSSVHNDTLFLARQNVMDYSLMIAIDENRKELVVGIIDCIRTYTWDKKLESWIKDRGFVSALVSASSGLGGQGVRGAGNRPTVTSPKEYKRRFREAMSRYVLEAPSCWLRSRPERRGDGGGVEGGRRERLIREDGGEDFPQTAS